MSEPGTIAEEAVRLLQAAQAWAQGLTGAGGAGDATGAGGHVDEAGAGAHTCRLCPACQLLAVVRGAGPEAFEHVADAVGSLTLAVRAALDALPPVGPASDPPAGRGPDAATRRTPRVQHIDVG